MKRTKFENNVAIWVLGVVAFTLSGGIYADKKPELKIARATAADTNYVKVIGVMDGDTIDVLREETKQTIRVRLANIDAPEKKQPYGSAAKKQLSEFTYGKHVYLVVTDTDDYGRSIGELFVDGKSINQEMVRRGYAWEYRQYSSDFTLAAMEQRARNERRGLWQDNDPIPPWEFRRQK